MRKEMYTSERECVGAFGSWLPIGGHFEGDSGSKEVWRIVQSARNFCGSLHMPDKEPEAPPKKRTEPLWSWECYPKICRCKDYNGKYVYFSVDGVVKITYY